MKQSIIIPITKERWRSIFNTGETVIPLIVLALFFLAINIPFLKIQGVLEWGSFMDIKDGLHKIMLSIMDENTGSILSIHSGSIADIVDTFFGGIILGSTMIAFGRYFIKTRLIIVLGILGFGIFIYVITKIPPFFDHLFDLIQAMPDNPLKKFFEPLGLDTTKFHVTLWVPVLVGICLTYFTIIGLKLTIYFVLSLDPLVSVFKDGSKAFFGLSISSDRARQYISWMTTVLAILCFGLLCVATPEILSKYLIAPMESKRDGKHSIDINTPRDASQDVLDDSANDIY